MPAGGNWVIQDKRRPGTFINVLTEAAPQPSSVGPGVVAVALPMNWGPEDVLIELTGKELTNGKSLAKVGCTAFDKEESLPYRLALSGCTKALLFRADKGGIQAKATVAANIEVKAKYPGVRGNDIEVIITNDKPVVGKSLVEVSFKGSVKDTFEITTAAPEELEDFMSDFVEFTVTVGALTVPAISVPLTAGTNGTVASLNYAKFFELLAVGQFNCLAIQSIEPEVHPLITAAVTSMRKESGKKVQGVVYNDITANYEGIVGVKQGFKTEVDVVTTSLFPLWVASQLAGAGSTSSKTAFEIIGAKEIINPISDEAVESNLQLGWFILTYRQDGAVCVEQDINTLHIYGPDSGYVFSKNRVVRCLDELSNLISLKFNRNYAGKIDNNQLGRNLFKGELIADMNAMQGKGAIQNFLGAPDILILPGQAIDAVVVDIAVQPVDSMEKLYVTVNVQA